MSEPSGTPRFIVGSVVATFALAVVFALGSAKVMHEPIAIPTISTAVFYLIASSAIVSAAMVALTRSILYSALSLLGTLLSVGALYVFLSADFVAITQLMVYVGGVLVLILFALMLTSRIHTASETNPAMGRVPATVLTTVVFALLATLAFKAPWKTSAQFVPTQTVESIGDLFLGEYLLPFEVISLLLLATLVTAVVVARKESIP
ncbi:MAG: NADH-quinone oxidoreductase subunit J [Myxococcaceae bacterium]